MTRGGRGDHAQGGEYGEGEASAPPQGGPPEKGRRGREALVPDPSSQLVEGWGPCFGSQLGYRSGRVLVSFWSEAVARPIDPSCLWHHPPDLTRGRRGCLPGLPLCMWNGACFVSFSGVHLLQPGVHTAARTLVSLCSLPGPSLTLECSCPSLWGPSQERTPREGTPPTSSPTLPCDHPVWAVLRAAPCHPVDEARVKSPQGRAETHPASLFTLHGRVLALFSA